MIFSSDSEPYQQACEGFQESLEEKGTVAHVSKYYLKRQESDLIFRRIDQERPDIVYTIGTRASKMAKEKIKNIPIVFSMVLDAEAMTNSHITGVSLNIPVKKKLEGIKKILPGAKRIGLIFSSKSASFYKEISHESTEMGFQLIKREIDSEREFPKALEDISSIIDCFLMVPDTGIYIPQAIRHLILTGFKKHFPVIGLSSFHTKAGALISFEADYRDLGRLSGETAQKILDGERSLPEKLPRPRKISFSLNLLVAERMGIRISTQVMKEATEVFGK